MYFSERDDAHHHQTHDRREHVNCCFLCSNCSDLTFQKRSTARTTTTTITITYYDYYYLYVEDKKKLKPNTVEQFFAKLLSHTRKQL